MFKQAELILTPICFLLSALLLATIIIRIRNIFFRKITRVAIWNSEVGIFLRVSRIIMAVSIPLMTASLIYLIFIIALPSAVIRVYAKSLFIIIFICWSLLETYLCFSVPAKLLKGSRWRLAVFLVAEMLCLGLVVLFFPKIPRSLPFPAKSECTVLDLPVRGLWLTGHAGASELTNPHTTNLYAIDLMKLGQDMRLHRGSEKSVSDFYSYNEPVYAPADGLVTQMIDTLESDLLGEPDRDNPGGNYIIMDIGDEKYVYLGHLKKGSISVKEGQKVAEGTVIGYVGNSGNSTLPHLHMHLQNRGVADQEGRITYPFRYARMHRKRLIFWRNISDGYLVRNDLLKE